MTTVTFFMKEPVRSAMPNNSSGFFFLTGSSASVHDMLYMISHNMLFGIAVNYTTHCQQHIEKCPVHLVSLIKHHGLFVPYIVANFTPPNQTFFFYSFYSFYSYARQRQHHTPTSPVSGALFGIAASTLFGKGLTVKNVTLTWYRLSNITDYSFHTLLTFLFF